VRSVGRHSVVAAGSAQEHRKRSLHCADIDEVMYFFPYSSFLIFGSSYVGTTCHGGGVGHALRASGFAESVKQEAESSEF
jgi:hypothetical protein